MGSASSTPRKRLKTSQPGYLGRDCFKATNYAVKDSIKPLQSEKNALKWWEQENDAIVSYKKSDDDKKKIKWNTLDHNGVVFAPEYVPHDIPMLYEEKQCKLTPNQEEIATMYAVMIETD